MGVLEGVRVLDLSQFLSGPRATQLLAEHGAEVIKIEAPLGETLRLLSTLFNAEKLLSVVNVNKKGLKLDLKSEKGKQVFLRLVEKSDVVVENLAPGAMERMGVGYEKLKQVNPRLVYARISGFGGTGPLKDELAFDLIAQATGGIMHANAMDDRPPGVFFGDLVSGAFCAMGIILALMDRERTGKGQLVDISMQDVMFYHNVQALAFRALERDREKIVSVLGRTVDKFLADPNRPMPFWYPYRAKDGHVAVVALTDRQWEGLMRAMGREDLVRDPRFANIVERVRNAEAGVEVIGSWMAERSVEEITEKLRAHGVPCGRVQDAETLAQDPQLRARGMLASTFSPRLGEVLLPGVPVKLSETQGEVKTPCPDLGEHTEEILKEVLGMGDEEIGELKKEGII